MSLLQSILSSGSRWGCFSFPRVKQWRRDEDGETQVFIVETKLYDFNFILIVKMVI